MRKFKYNKHGVCLNPIGEILFKDKRFHFAIKLASNNKGHWSYGYDYECKGSGVGCGLATSSPSFARNQKNYASKEVARKVALQDALREAISYAEKFPASKLIAAIEQKIQGTYLPMVVLPKELFNAQSPANRKHMKVATPGARKKKPGLQDLLKDGNKKVPLAKLAGALRSGGRPIKSDFPRVAILKIRISKEHLQLISQAQGAKHMRTGKTYSQADIVEDALVEYCRGMGYAPDNSFVYT